MPSIIFGLLRSRCSSTGSGYVSRDRSSAADARADDDAVIVIASRNAIKSVPPSTATPLWVSAPAREVVFTMSCRSRCPAPDRHDHRHGACAGRDAPLLLVGMRAFIATFRRHLLALTVLPMQFLWSDEVDRGFVEKTSAAIIVLLSCCVDERLCDLSRNIRKTL